jgi:hypothetical protein
MKWRKLDAFQEVLSRKAELSHKMKCMPGTDPGIFSQGGDGSKSSTLDLFISTTCNVKKTPLPKFSKS